MTAFEYVIVLISIILGLGITTILTGVAELIKQTRLSGLYAPYIIWIALVFVIYIQEWWVTYELKSVQAWTLHKFLIILIYPISLYILAHLLFPTGVSREFTSKEFYLNNYPRLFIGVIILDIQSIIHNLAFSGLALQTQIPHLVVIIILSYMITTKTKSSRVHTAVALVLLLILLVSLAIERRVIY
jgi:hypothetical protein